MGKEVLLEQRFRGYCGEEVTVSGKKGVTGIGGGKDAAPGQ